MPGFQPFLFTGHSGSRHRNQLLLDALENHPLIHRNLYFSQLNFLLISWPNPDLVESLQFTFFNPDMVGTCICNTELLSALLVMSIVSFMK